MAHLSVLILLVSAAEVPAVGCAGEGQSGTPARVLKPVSIPELDPRTASQLAYFDFRFGLGVLAPRGWTCFGLTGSSGDMLAVSPRETRRRLWDHTLTGPAILIVWKGGGGSGRIFVAETIANAFPRKRAFFADFKREFGWTPPRSGPYPTDRLIYPSDSVVEYRTPAQTAGLGTQFLKQDNLPISGVAMLVGSTPDLVHLAVRLPANLADLTPAILAHAKRLR